jgi:hypothetical protein
LPVAGRNRGESTIDRTRLADGWKIGAHKGYIGTARPAFKCSWI